MAIDGKSDADIVRILRSTRSIALVGASARADRPSHRVMAYLLGRGYEVHPINPGLAGGELLDRPVVADLGALTAPVDMIDVFRNAEAVGDIVDQALGLAARPKVIWLQLGVINVAAAARAEAAGIEVVMDRCPAIEIPRLGL